MKAKMRHIFKKRQTAFSKKKKQKHFFAFLFPLMRFDVAINYNRVSCGGAVCSLRKNSRLTPRRIVSAFRSRDYANGRVHARIRLAKAAT